MNTEITPATSLDRLRDAVQREGGDWTTRRAVNALNGWPTPGRARVLLNKLAAEGLLIKHGKIGHTWTQPAPMDLDQFTAAVLRAVATIPGVTSAEQVDGQPPGTLAVKVGDDWYGLRVTH